ncbi:hypothetical protein LSUE1_G002808 [Lachnellula suecica]|uniref:Asl1-like glycosyl hydrolase catalytic domain-containing protein n=1 Tax=Lachnellula suecica TaxID=602035 RepID=A0A8T9C894_9HELO|nr:hypothetical protein LSUE1_G002808 [Lachnellula suecica]
MFILPPILVSILTLALFVSAGRPVSDKTAPRRGLAYNDPPTWIQQHSRTSPAGEPSQCRWAYNWGSNMDNNVPANLEFMPMLWDASPGNTDNWHRNVGVALARGSNHLLSFNEPDRCSSDHNSACMSPEDAANAHIKWMNPHNNEAYIGAPAVTNSVNKGEGLDWLNQWFIAYGSTAQQIAFLNDVMPFMDGAPWVERYAWFWTDPAFTGGTLTNFDGSPTELGHFYDYRGF